MCPAGILPILIVPASNDGAFDPSRSVLDGSTPEAERNEFAGKVRTAREAESADPQAAISAYGRLIELHPEFAEVHYRLGRLLVQMAERKWRGAFREGPRSRRPSPPLPFRFPADHSHVAARYDCL